MYYQPCIAALFGTNIGATPDTEPQYFLAYGWLTHDACGYLSCLADNMRWDRSNGGCIPSGISGITPFADTDVAENFCAKKSDDTDEGPAETCKHTGSDLKAYGDQANNCWAAGGSTPSALMSHFCMPSLSGELADQAHRGVVDALMITCCTGPAAS